MNSNLSEVKVGDYIWTIKNGWEPVVRILNDKIHAIETKVIYYTIKSNILHNKWKIWHT